jgi:cleavage and polyadenylation specificity factor subunit 2
VQEFVEAKTSEERNKAREIKKAGQAPSWAKKGKMIAKDEMEGVEDEERKEVATTDGTEEEGEEDVWSGVWQLRMSEVRDAFLSVNAVRWTQPVHLQGEQLPFILFELSSASVIPPSCRGDPRA